MGRKKKMITVPYAQFMEMQHALRDLSIKVANLNRRDKDYLTSTEVCSLLQISHNEFLEYRMKGVIKTYIISDKMVVNKDELQAVIASRQL